MVARELEKRLVPAQHTSKNTADIGNKYSSERHNEENVVGIAATVLWKEAWDWYDGGRFGKGVKDIDRNDCSV